MSHTSQETQLIETLLAQAGWAVQSLSDPARTDGRSVAIRDHPQGQPLPLYLLVIDVQVVGVVYAEQAIVGRRDCERAKRADGVLMPAGLTRVRAQLPFTYYSTGDATDFLNCLEEEAQPQRVAGFHRPEVLMGWLEQAREGVSEREAI